MLRQGEGEPLVLLHGIIASERFWVRVIPKLADGFEAIAPPTRGSGPRVSCAGAG